VSSYISSDKDALRSMSANKIVTSDLQQSLLAVPPKQELLDIPKVSEYLPGKTSSAGDVTDSEVSELINSFVPIDPIMFESVDSVEVVETISMPDKASVADKRFENNLDLIHPASVAAAEEIKWANDTKGKVSKEFADAAAARWTRNFYNKMPWLNGKVVIGEGERDEAAMLYIGEEVGAGQHGGPGTVGVDIAGDVLELTNGINTAAVRGSVSTAAYAETGGIRSAPDIYLTYWKIGPQAKGAEINVTLSPEQNLQNIAKASNKDVGQLKGAMLLRERHINRLLDLVEAGVTVGEENKLMSSLLDAAKKYRTKPTPENLEKLMTAYKPLDQEVKRIGVYKSGNIYLLADGDLMPVFGLQKGILDFMTGAGGAPEGELSASALISMGGAMSARYCSYTALKETKWGADLDRDWSKFSEKEQKRLKSFGFASPDSPEEGKASWGKVWTAEELVTGREIVFIASGVKNSPWLDNLKAPALDENTGILYVYTIRSTKSGDTRIWKIGYKTPIPRLKAAILKTTDEADKAELYYKLAQAYGRLACRDKALDILRGLPDTIGVTTSVTDKYFAAYKYYQGMYYLLDVNNKEDLALRLFEDAYSAYHTDEMRARDRIFMISQFKGDNLAKQKEYDKAVYYYKKALAIRPEDAQLIAKIAKANDSMRAVKSSSEGDISKVEAAIQITPEAEPGDLAFAFRYAKETPMVLINHSELKDYLGGTTKRSNEQLRAFLEVGYDAIVAFGDFPMEYKGKDYLAAGIRKFPDTVEGMEAMRSNAKSKNLDYFSQLQDLYYEANIVRGMTMEAFVVMYNNIPLVAELKDNDIMSLWQALDNGLISLDQAKIEVIKEISTEMEILYELNVLFDGIDKFYLDQILLTYEPVQAIREVAIPIALAGYRRLYIQEAIADKLGAKEADIDIIYGGGGSISNILELAKVGYTGAFIGRASALGFAEEGQNSTSNIAKKAMESPVPLTLLFNSKSMWTTPADHLDAYKLLGVDSNKVNITHVVSRSDYIPWQQAIKGEDTEALFADRSNVFASPVLLAVTAEAGIGEYPEGAYCGNIPAEFLKKAGVSVVLFPLDLNESHRSRIIEELKKVGIDYAEISEHGYQGQVYVNKNKEMWSDYQYQAEIKNVSSKDDVDKAIRKAELGLRTTVWDVPIQELRLVSQQLYPKSSSAGKTLKQAKLMLDIASNYVSNITDPTQITSDKIRNIKGIMQDQLDDLDKLSTEDILSKEKIRRKAEHMIRAMNFSSEPTELINNDDKIQGILADTSEERIGGILIDDMAMDISDTQRKVLLELYGPKSLIREALEDKLNVDIILYSHYIPSKHKKPNMIAISNRDIKRMQRIKVSMHNPSDSFMPTANTLVLAQLLLLYNIDRSNVAVIKQISGIYYNMTKSRITDVVMENFVIKGVFKLNLPPVVPVDKNHYAILEKIAAYTLIAA